jgi:hypothetical protein
MSNSIPDINARTPQDKERILEQTEKKIMRNERLWNTNRLYRLIVQTIVDAVLPNYYHDPQSVRRNNPVEYRASVASIKEEYSKFIKERWVPLINIQLSLGEGQARENGFDDETVIGDSNVNLCAMILGGKDTPSPWCAWCEQYDTMTSIYNDGIEGRFQDLRNIGDTYDRSEIPRSFVNLKNMMYYECVDCNKEIYSQPNRCLREECKCSDCD